MIQRRIAFPLQAKYDKVIPKTKIYRHSEATKSIKELFVSEVEQIKWSYKLAPETINLPASESVPEIQIFTVMLRSGDRTDDVLRAIDKAIPFPILFELYLNDQLCYGATYKRPNEADKSKWVIGDYFFSEWTKDTTESSALPVVLNLTALYHQLIKEIAPFIARQDETIPDFIGRIEVITKLSRDAKRLEKRINKEKQFNRRVELNHELNNIKDEIKELSSNAEPEDTKDTNNG